MNCCVCDKEKENSEVTVSTQANPATEGMVQVPEPKAANPAEEAQTSARSHCSASPEERDQAKERLQSLVKVFVSEALQGVDCTIVDPQDAKQSSAKYILDPGLREIRFQEMADIVVDLSQLLDVHVYADLKDLAQTDPTCKKPADLQLDKS